MQEPDAAAKERHRDAVATDMPIDSNATTRLCSERLPDLKRRGERLPHFQRLDAHGRARLVAHALDLRIRFGHRDNRERQLQYAAHQDAADFPIAEMASDQQRAAPFGTRHARRSRRSPALRSNRRCVSSGDADNARRKSIVSAA